MCKILQIETATEVCSVSISKDGNAIGLRETHEGRSHSAVLASFVHELLQENGLSISHLNAVAVSMGPGSYTGLRIGVSLAKGLCYGAGIPLIAINTLESMCTGLFLELTKNGHKIHSKELFAPMIDARRMEVFTSLFDSQMNLIKRTHALEVEENSFNDLLNDHPIYFFGSGADKLRGTIVHSNARFITDFRVSASYLSSMAYEAYCKHKFEDLAYFEPYYLKDFITTISKNKI